MEYTSVRTKAQEMLVSKDMEIRKLKTKNGKKQEEPNTGDTQGDIH